MCVCVRALTCATDTICWYYVCRTTGTTTETLTGRPISYWIFRMLRRQSGAPARECPLGGGGAEKHRRKDEIAIFRFDAGQSRVRGTVRFVSEQTRAQSCRCNRREPPRCVESFPLRQLQLPGELVNITGALLTVTATTHATVREMWQINWPQWAVITVGTVPTTWRRRRRRRRRSRKYAAVLSARNTLVMAAGYGTAKSFWPHAHAVSQRSWPPFVWPFVACNVALPIYLYEPGSSVHLSAVTNLRYLQLNTTKPFPPIPLLFKIETHWYPSVVLNRRESRQIIVQHFSSHETRWILYGSVIGWKG